MSLRQAALALARLAPAACCEARAAATQQPQQLASLWSYLGRRGYATSAATEQAAPAPASAAAAAATSWAAATAAAAPPAQLSAQQPGPEVPDLYVRLDERVSAKYEVQRKRVFAVVEVGGTQYKVTPNDVIVVEKLADVDVNDTLRLQRVIMLGSQAETIIGRPYVPGAAVAAAVEEQFLDGKVLIFHKRRRKNSRRLRGHRQPLTTLRILDVAGIDEAPAAAAAAAS